jgi:hypothetical protein
MDDLPAQVVTLQFTSTYLRCRFFQGMHGRYCAVVRTFSDAVFSLFVNPADVRLKPEDKETLDTYSGNELLTIFGLLNVSIISSDQRSRRTVVSIPGFNDPVPVSSDLIYEDVPADLDYPIIDMPDPGVTIEPVSPDILRKGLATGRRIT